MKNAENPGFKTCFQNLMFTRCTWQMQYDLSGQRLALGNQSFPVQVRLLPMCRGELYAVIPRLISKCL